MSEPKIDDALAAELRHAISFNSLRDRAEAAEARVKELEDEVDCLKMQLKEATNTPPEHHFNAGCAVERAAVVAWLRLQAEHGVINNVLADAIDAGAHRKEKP